MHFRKQLLAAAISSLCVSGAWATNGYAPHGVGQKSQGMGGVGVAYSQDALAGGVNPAGMVHVGNRIDLGVNLFRPQRESTAIGGPTFDGNDKELFLIPEFGYNRMLDANSSFGVSVFGTGGMNTDYSVGPYSGFGMTAPTGVDLMQLFIVPTYAIKLNENHSVGIGLNLAAQAFSAKGIAGFGGFGVGSIDPANLSDNGHDISYGAGLRIGWQGKVSDMVTLGATYQTRTYMSEFDDYRGLFAEQGDFDIPENFAIGIAVAATPKLNIAFDVMRINYSKVNAIGNLNNFFAGAAQLGADNGAGFGWEDQTIYKLGFDYAYSQNLTLRAGFNHADNPIPSSQTTFNVLAPGVVEDHLTLGATWTLDSGNELTFSYMHAFENTVNGDMSMTGSYNLKMHQDAIGVAYSWKM
ncbi:OmpP1/FadL family transporter [Sedimenticola selenatireducens]|uniref:OmpP1/FadL family transporter n=1 Tax=Sedimenticola selenatireducens TaxID=191960 RepID=UPI003F4AAE0B